MKRKTVAGMDCRYAPVFPAVNEAFSHFFHQRLIFWLLFYQEKSNNKNSFSTNFVNANQRVAKYN
ncbi:hypothetical protein, partial [Candidatus Cardinium sp. cByotN1]|uniref:hypothetical protein n=1 Tax=Candidatus Cardinium sp. cByotN1 TaxID=2699439 RepID=UPI001FB449C8